MHRGEIWVERLNPNQGAEVGKLRPVVILQADPITQAGLAPSGGSPAGRAGWDQLNDCEAWRSSQQRQHHVG